MKKSKEAFICIIGAILFVIGIVMVFNSVSIASDLTDAFITKAGHSFETSQLNTIFSGHITNTQICGTVISVVGGLAAVLFGYLYWKKR